MEPGAESRGVAFFCLSASLVAVVLIGLTSTSAASPACPRLLAIGQPDGSFFSGRIRGDEYYHWTETENGYPIVVNPKTRAWEYARLDPQLGLVPSGQVVGKAAAAGIGRTTARDFRFFVRKRAQETRDLQTLEFSCSGVPIVGPRNVLVILVNFADRSLITTEADWESRVFGTTNSVKHYYSEVSYDQLTLTPVAESSGLVNNGVVVVTLASNHPNPPAFGAASQQLVKDAILAANPFVDFTPLDTDGNGKITTNEVQVIVTAAGFEGGYSTDTPAVFAHQAFIGSSVAPPSVDGRTVGGYPGGYVLLGELHADHQATLGVIVHELAHDLGTATRFLGLRDLYDGDGSSSGVGDWDAMSFGMWRTTTYPGDTPTQFSAWSKLYLGWVTPTQISVSTTGVTFPQVETAAGADHGVRQLLSNPNGPEMGGSSGEYFLLENRQKTGYDSQLPGAGILIWHVDESQINNTDDARRLVDLEEADGLNQLDDRSSGGDQGDPFPGSSNNTTFDDSSNPDSRLYVGLPLGMTVTNISGSAATMTADIIVGAPPPLPQLLEVWRIDRGSRSYLPDTDTWRGIAYNPATDHLLVVSRTNAPGGQAAGVWIWDAATGAELGYMSAPSAVINGGTFALSKIGVGEDGRIYGANLQLAGSGVFKIYRWDNESASPGNIVTISSPAQRIGDAFRVVGGGASTRIYASGFGNNTVRVFDGDGNLLQTLTLAGTGAEMARHGIAPVAGGDGSSFWGTGVGQPMRKWTATGSLIGTVSTSVVPAPSSSALCTHGGTILWTNRHYINAPNYPNNLLKVDVSGPPGSETVLLVSPRIGPADLMDQVMNGTFELTHSDSRNWIFVLSERNAIGAYADTIYTPPQTSARTDWGLYY